ncbi:MAG TPA: RNA polymerase sigma-70 factor [Ktedonobacteraceae bacterium]|nr:RNA polymerase sigma-70 factor [Ktedonobacteraceae bacterium]
METFETYRRYLFSLAYRMLGSAMDAEDLVQETYLRYQATPPQTIHSLQAYLTTILTHLCLDSLELARRKREVYVGPWLPEPILTEGPPEEADPEKRAEREESISLAFLILLERLQPFERAVFLLHQVFAYEFAEIASMLQKSEAACRRSFSRARQHLIEGRPRFQSSPDQHRQLLTSFQAAVERGDMTTLTHLLADNVTLWTDGGGKTRKALLRPICGREKVARMSLASKRIRPQNAQVELREVNGQLALITSVAGRAWSCFSIEIEHGLIQVIRIILNPDKLAQITRETGIHESNSAEREE